MDLTDAQWDVLKPLLPKPRVRKDGRGRPWRDPRDVLNGILWVLRTGAPWKDLPDRYPSYQTCHRRFQRWNDNGVLKKVLRALYKHLRENGVEDIEGFIDGSYAKAKKGDPKSENAVPARRQRSWRLQTAMVFLSPSASRMVRDMMSR
jgi:transposase